MAISLQKGGKVNLSKAAADAGVSNLKKAVIGLGWDANEFSNGADFDLDAEAFMVGTNGKCTTDKEFIFYNNLEHTSGAVKHMGDNLTGGSGDDDEQIIVDLMKVPANIQKITFTVTIYDAFNRRQNFGQVSNAFIRICDELTGKEIIRYDLSEEFSIETAVVFGELYKYNNEWKFNAIGGGYQGGLAALCDSLGIDTK